MPYHLAMSPYVGRGDRIAVGPCLHVERSVATGDSNARHSIVRAPLERGLAANDYERPSPSGDLNRESNDSLQPPRVGLEPTTLRLTAECSTIELSRNVRIA